MKIVYYTQTIFLDSDFPLLQEFQKQGHEIMVFIILAPYSLRGTLVDIKEMIQRDDIVPVDEYSEIAKYKKYMSLENMYFVNRTTSSVRTMAYFRTMRKMCKMIKDFNPKVVHTTMPLDTLDLMLLQFKPKLVMTMHDPFLHSGRESLRCRIFRDISIKMVSKIVLLNAIQKEKFKKYYGVRENRILLNRIGNYNYMSAIQTAINIGDNFNILFFGHIASYKGLEYLCEAMTEVHKTHPNATLTIAGGGKMYFDFSLYENLDYIELRNYYIGMEELASLLERCSVVVCPYKDATQSGVIMTAFAKNRPIVASNVGALGEQIKDGKTGILIPPCDAKALSTTLIHLADNPTILKKMEKNIEERNNHSDNSWTAIANRYIEFYKQ